VGTVDLSLTPVDFTKVVVKPQWYQVRGAFPASPWATDLSVAAQNITVTVQADGLSILVTGPGLAALGSVFAGDWVYLGGSTFGDPGNFAATNQGFWVVVSVGTGLLLRRADEADGTAPATETVAAVGTSDVQHIPNATRPRWLFIRGPGSSGLPAFVGLKQVLGAAKGWLLIATEPQFIDLAAVSVDRLVAAPFYIRYVRVESDQPVVLQVGDIAAAVNEVSLLPFTGVPAWYESLAFVTSLAVFNSGSEQATINIIYAYAQE
jgi:hypothetical protein